jgi:hypothetical protein
LCVYFLPSRGEGAVKSRIDPRVSTSPGPGKAKLLDRVREAIRLKHYSLRTEQTYIDWIKRFILFHGKQHPELLGGEAVRDFLSDLASTKNVAASTQNQAFSALLFLYREVLKQELPWIADIERAKHPPKIPGCFYAGRSPGRALETSRHGATNGTFALWVWITAHGMPAPANQGHRLWISSSHSP